MRKWDEDVGYLRKLSMGIQASENNTGGRRESPHPRGCYHFPTLLSPRAMVESLPEPNWRGFLPARLSALTVLVVVSRVALVV